MLNVGIIYGGQSTEHDISILSSKYVIDNIDKNKYNVTEIYIDKKGNWKDNTSKKDIINTVEFLKKFNVIFPVLHGLYGEDGSLQGMLELIGIPYVGCGVLSSAICMDKVYAKIIFDRCKIKHAKSIFIKYISNNKYMYFDKEFNERIVTNDDLKSIINTELKYPIFVKPSNSGSSIGMQKVHEYNKLKEAIENAAKYDSKILIEEGIIGKEVEVAVLGNPELGMEVSNVGEISPIEEFYSYSSKYENSTNQTNVPADLTKEQSEKIKKIAKQLFMAIDGNGLSRIDFFVEDNTGEIYINEINTLPGLTNISMYPILMEQFGYSKTELINKLLHLAKAK